MKNDHLLTTPIAKRLYYECAANLPLVDYHNHLSVQEIAENRRFEDIAELWLLGDPYKHRVMRICGVPEELISGKASHLEKFRAWCKTYPKLMGGPLYDWSRMEMEDLFDIHLEINEENADAIWAAANEKLAQPEFTAQGLLRRFHVEYAAPCMALTEDLSVCSALEEIAPSLRGDDLIKPGKPLFSTLQQQTGIEITSFDSLMQAISMRLDAFHAVGCRFSDHALDNGFVYVPDDGGRDKRFQAVLCGDAVAKTNEQALVSDMLRALACEYAKRNWTLQLHIGAERFTSSRLRAAVGQAGGFAGIGNPADITSLTKLLDDLEQAPYGLPKTILYTLNPAANASFAVLSGSYVGVTQGPAWWWCDHLQGMRQMLDEFSNFSVLSTFVGMTTDSRSLLSLLRHDYFRRCVCGWLGEKVQRGEMPDSFEALSELVTAVCYGNAKALLRLSKNASQSVISRS